MEFVELRADQPEFAAALEALPNRPAVFLLWPEAGKPYLAKTNLLRRRLLRLLREREEPSRLLTLRQTVKRIEYRLTGSTFEAGFVIYEQARRHFPETYLEHVRLRMPPYIKILVGNEYPRSQITTQLSRSGSLYYGPFRSRASAERFEAHLLDLFQMRRCQEDLAPSPMHPGCIYGEMGMCLRPCQQAVSPEEYRHEVARVLQFLETDGRSLAASIEHSRDRLSEEMRFEEAARQHKRLEKVLEVLRLRDGLARDLDRFAGVAVTRSLHADAVQLWPFYCGYAQQPLPFSFQAVEGKAISLDRRLRETFGEIQPRLLTVRERQEHLALLARWYYSSWCDGEWLAFDRWEEIPYRKLIQAVSRVARHPSPSPSGSSAQEAS
jgi:excinuclease ABC subunit C